MKLLRSAFLDELSKKRWRRFFNHRGALGSVAVLLILSFFSMTAEFWANSRPLVLKFHGRIYFPILEDLKPADLGINDGVFVDFRKLPLGSEDFAIWPLIKWDPFERNTSLETLPSAPTAVNWMGTDEGGRDVASRLLYGFRYSMGYALATWFFCSILGIGIGALMGYYGGWVDLIGQRVIEVWESVPTLMLLIILASIWAPTITILIWFTVFFSWVGISMYTRAEFLKLRKLEYIEAARAVGVSELGVMVKHILPNSLTPWLTMTPFLVAGAVYGLSALDYLGFGLPAPTPSWGEMLGQAQKHFQVAWWLAVYPSLALFVTLTALNLIGSALRDAFDPRKTL